MSRMGSMRRAAAATFLLCNLACSYKPPAPVYAPPPPGIEADPRWLTFRCVEPPCSTKLTTTIRVLGTRDVAIKRAVLSDETRPDFIVAPDRAPPFILKAMETLAIAVTYKPTGDPRLGDVDLLVTYTDAAAGESMDRIPPGELHVPLVRRLVGEPALAALPARLDFGPVLPNSQKALPLFVKNEGFGNVGLVIQSIAPDLGMTVTATTDVQIGPIPSDAILPGRTATVSVTFAPTAEEYLEGGLTVRSEDPNAAPVMVGLLGTSIAGPSIAATPERGVDFGSVPVGTTATAAVAIENRGTADLLITTLDVTGAGASGNLRIAFPRGANTSTIGPLSAIHGVLTLDATAPGPLDARVHVRSDDRHTPTLDIPVAGLVTQPKVSVTPMMVGYGTIPRGWTKVEAVQIENSGYGDLKVTNVGLVLGSSQLFSLRTVPQLPVKLRHAERIAVEVEFRSEAEATFHATLAIDSNDAVSSHVEIGLTATGASCEMGCPIAHGTPSCTAGICSILSCDMGWYDTNMDPSDGCECQGMGPATSAFCADADYLGTLVDGHHDRTVVTANLPVKDVVQVWRFFGKEDSGLDIFDDNYDVRVRLESADPTIGFCVYHHETGSHDPGCYMQDESCPSDRTYRHTGRTFHDDSADYIIRVTRPMGTAPACTSYTLFISNG